MVKEFAILLMLTIAEMNGILSQKKTSLITGMLKSIVSHVLISLTSCMSFLADTNVICCIL